MDEKQKKKDNQLKRGLNRRHLQMIAIGGSIGTGLFLAMGGTIRSRALLPHTQTVLLIRPGALPTAGLTGLVLP